MNVIDIRDLSFAYGDERVLREVSLQVAQGNTRCCWVRTGRERVHFETSAGRTETSAGNDLSVWR